MQISNIDRNRGECWVCAQQWLCVAAYAANTRTVGGVTVMIAVGMQLLRICVKEKKNIIKKTLTKHVKEIKALFEMV